MNDRCDLTVGPCSCGAWHSQEEVLFLINIKQAAQVVASWPKWKIENMKAVFSEPEPKIPSMLKNIVHPK